MSHSVPVRRSTVIALSTSNEFNNKEAQEQCRSDGDPVRYLGFDVEAVEAVVSESWPDLERDFLRV